MRKLRIYALVALLCLLQSPLANAADSKLSTYQRQVNLMKRINDAQKTKQLTERQARGLRKDLSKIAERKQKDRDKNVGSKEPVDMSNVEERLTKISAKIDELKAENVRDAAEEAAEKAAK